uniref:Uncharacterized protein n=1 Tax=Arundo donax TaxID=35708 RepID=A0A0A9FU73_ARUDO
MNSMRVDMQVHSRPDDNKQHNKLCNKIVLNKQN